MDDKGIKCLVPSCPNHSSKGYGKFLIVYDSKDNPPVEEPTVFICTPCWLTITGKEPNKYAMHRIIDNCF